MTDSRQNEALPLRRIARQYALQYLYQVDMSKGEHSKSRLIKFWDQALELVDRLDEKEWNKTTAGAEAFILGVLEHREVLDERITKQARNWSIERMAVVDRNILRVGLYEILYCDDIPSAVTINEAVALAKGYADDKSSGFINGILDNIAKAEGKA